MESKDMRSIRGALAEPFAPEDLEWRLQTTLEDKMRGLAVPYVTNRAIQSRLDDVVGPENWHNEYRPWHSAGKKESQICGISIYFEGRGWVTKWDGAEDTDIEPVKGGLSDSMKRAAVQWGVGRVLYNMDTVWVAIEKRGRSFVICDSERSKLDRAYINMLDKLKQLPANATGTQSQLTPLRDKNAPSETPTPPQVNAPSKAAPVLTPEFPKPQEPEYAYLVEKAQIQEGMRETSTLVLLKNREGRSAKAFAQGTHPELKAGTKLKSAKLTLRKQDSVVFYILESYEIAQPTQRAA